MEMQTQKMLRRRKMLLVLPLVMSAFTTLLFMALGGGQAEGRPQKQQAGLNTRLPDARLKDDHDLSKMSYYDRAASDSRKLKEQMKTDPYYKSDPVADTAGAHFPASTTQKPAGILRVPQAGDDPQKSEAKVYRKLAELQTVINRPAAENKNDLLKNTGTDPATANPARTPAGEDPELRQMNGLLEKILDIQHPGRLKEKTDQALPAENKKFQAIPAVIDGNQKITQGTVVRLKLLDTITLSGQLIPKGQLIFASGNLYNQRLTLNIKNIRVGYIILPVDLTVFDMTDGLEGVNVPEAITGDALKDGASSGVQGVEFMSLDPTLTTQLAGAGLNTAQGLFSKKVKRIKAKLKDGHQLLLRNNKTLNAVK